MEKGRRGEARRSKRDSHWNRLGMTEGRRGEEMERDDAWGMLEAREGLLCSLT